MKYIRNSVKAVILREGQVLMTRNRDGQGDFYLLPGGGQEPEETMHQALLRECLEELGCPVEVGPLLFLCEYIGEKRHVWEKTTHQIEYMFRCTLAHGAEPGTGALPDDMQTGVEWVPVTALASRRHYPPGLAAALRDPDGAPVYWGNVKDR